MTDLTKLREPLNISDIDFRVQSINKGGYATLLAYKNARVDMNRLDDVLGAGLWQRDFKLINNVLYCGVAIYNDKIGDWVWKWDAGTESHSDKDKGRASDAFKRACTNMGIGRELYEFPIINIKLNDNEFEIFNDKARQTFNLKLRDWRWMVQRENGSITFLAAKDEKDVVRFKWGKYNEALNKDYVKPSSEEEETVPYYASVEDESNAEGLLKKIAEVPNNTASTQKEEAPVAPEPIAEVDEERVRVLAWYVDTFGKEPRSDMKTENMIKKIVERQTEIAKEKEQSLLSQNTNDEAVNTEDDVPEFIFLPKEEEITEQEEDDVLNGWSSELDMISTFSDKNEFISWARSVVESYKDDVTPEMIADFRNKCNEHFKTM